MNKVRQRSSVRWRIVLIYFLLVFIAMTIVSVFLLDQMKSYQITSLKENLTKTISESNLLTSLGKYADLNENTEEIQNSLNENWSSSFSEELSVVCENFNICASTNQNIVGRSAADVFDSNIIVDVFINKGNGESDSVISGDIPVKNLCYPIISESTTEVIGAVYVRVDLSSINSFLSQSKLIFIQAMFIALIVTVLLGFVIARSITVPINNVTRTVMRMSQGDFSQTVEVKSDDEIGQLAEMFNLLREKLDFTLSEISNEKNKLETILTYMADGLIAIDLEGSVIHANPAAREMLGISESEDLTGVTYESLLGHLSDRMKLSVIKENCKDDGGQDTFDYGATTYAVRYDRFKDDYEQDVGIIIIMQDITERQKLEKMQKDFVANVSHELKTPLTTIKSYTETLLDGALEDKETAVNFLNIVDMEADRMNRLVKDLLQLSRLDYRQEKWNIKENNIIPLINTAATKVQMTASQKNQQLNRRYDLTGDIRVLIDRDRFEQVMMNVLSNAIKYTQDGGRIDVDASVLGPTVKITVQDNGIGVAESEIPRIFERFYRVDKARSRAMGGTGLGLAITKQIVEEHHGKIEAESKEGDGTKITITLPLAPRRGRLSTG
ncbi:MAG: cell wall metabolism sensor histidine kinase WalK [Clostridia bacterium]|nr:cell wall metabolism sensor histidine kinase WalK [Clostridia bacterium]